MDKPNIDKVKLESSNIADENFEKLASLFPNVVTETIVNDRVERVIDVDKLKQEINSHVVEGLEERYNFTWPDKRKSVVLANAPTRNTLRACKEESKDFDNTENLYIEGDNLEVLKLLRNTYLGQVKMIYIDPPYNTGKDFVYKDNFFMSKEDYLENSGQIDENGNKYFPNTEINGRFHTDWLNMMYPRLKMARDFLSNDGVIFISIDDNEVSNLRKICDEIFGEKNFVAILCVEISKTQGMKVAAAQNGTIVKNHEYIIIYQKNIFAEVNRQLLYDKSEPWDSHFNCVIKNNNGKITKYNLNEYVYKTNPFIFEKFKRYGFIKDNSIDMKKIGIAIELDDEIKKYFYHDISNIIYQEMPCSINIDNDIMLKLKSENIIQYDKYLLTLSSGNKLRQYRSLYENLHQTDEYLSEYTRTTIRGALWKGFYSDMMNITKEGYINFKNGKKPVRLIKQLIYWANISDSLILDFFSGSATTAHAVMQLNAEDGGNRKYIMVQLPEKTPEDSEARKAGYNTICEIGKERIRRAGEKIKKDYPNANIDTGFRVFKLDSSNMEDVYYKAEDLSQQDIRKTISNIKADRSNEDLLFQIILSCGIPLKCKIEIKKVNNRDVYFIDDTYLLVCFEKDIDEKTIEELAKKKPNYMVFNQNVHDSILANIEQIFSMISNKTNIKEI